MSEQLERRLFDELEQIPLIDPHTHINPHAAASETLADILGYHYYTELAHSAGLARERIEEPGLEPRELVARLAPFLDQLDNTVQVSWLVEMCREFFGFEGERIGSDNWESVYDAALKAMSADDWEETVLRHSGLEQVYLTNDFDDPLEGFDTSLYVPCLRTDDLVFQLARQSPRDRFEQATGTAISDSASLKSGLGQLFEHFTSRGARACAISLPPDFTPTAPDVTAADGALARVRLPGGTVPAAALRAVAALARDAVEPPVDVERRGSQDVVDGGAVVVALPDPLHFEIFEVVGVDLAERRVATTRGVGAPVGPPTVVLGDDRRCGQHQQ